MDGDLSPALKLAFEPDDYLCTWELPDENGARIEASGMLTLAAGRPPRGDVHGRLPIQWAQTANGGRAAGFPQNVDLPSVVARLANGATAVITDARVTYWSDERGYISGAAAIVTGSRAADAASTLFEQLELQVAHLDSLAGVPPLKHMRFPTAEGRAHLEGTWSVDGNPESSQLWVDDEIQMRLEYDATIRTFDPYSYGMAFSPVVRLEAARAIDIAAWVQQWVEPIRRITSIATGDACEVTYLAVRHAAKERPAPRGQVFGVGITQDPFASSQRDVRDAESAVFLKHDDISLLTLVRAWQMMTEDRHPLVETYGAMLHARDQHPRSRFLLLIQAIEGTHGYETRERYEARRAAHEQTRSALIAAVQAHLDSAQLRFMKANLRKDPPVGLEESLNASVTTLPVDLMPRIGESELVAAAKAGPRKPETVAAALRVVRNDLAHGLRGYDAHDLHEVVEVLERVVRAHALRLLGCADVALERVLTAPW